MSPKKGQSKQAGGQESYPRASSHQRDISILSIMVGNREVGSPSSRFGSCLNPPLPSFDLFLLFWFPCNCVIDYLIEAAHCSHWPSTGLGVDWLSWAGLLPYMVLTGQGWCMS